MTGQLPGVGDRIVSRCGFALAMLLTGCLNLIAPTIAIAGSHTLEPNISQPFSVNGWTCVILRFDVTQLPLAGGIEIDEALLEWSAPAMESKEQYEFNVVGNAHRWTGVAKPGILESMFLGLPEDVWEFEQVDRERIGQSLVRLNLTSLARLWLVSSESNNGVVLYSPSISVEEAGDWVRGARLALRCSEDP